MIKISLNDIIKSDTEFTFNNGIYDCIKNKDNLHTTTKKVAAFYEEEPFPNYDDVISRDQLIKSAELTKFPKAIKNLIKMNSTVLEVGCGTGQLTNYLGIGSNRTIIGTDLSLNSLKIAESFRSKGAINNTHFVRGDILDLPFYKNRFDIVIANGVLHHTRDTWLALSCAVDMLRPNGIIIIGLYNKFGRWRTNLTRLFSNKIGLNVVKLLDPLVGKLKKGDNEIRSWINDQYFHPVERSHTFEELLERSKQFNITPLRFLPDVKNYDLEDDLDLSLKRSIGSKMDRLICQTTMAIIDNADGGLFVGVFKKNDY